MDKDDFMAVAWAGFVRWALSEPKVVTEFNAATGRRLLQPASPIESMIDDACGVLSDDMHAFVLWVTENMWGVDEAPQPVQDEIARKKIAP